MAKKNPSKHEQEVIESFQIVMKMLSELRMDHQALKLAVAEKGVVSKKDLDLALEVVREETQRQGDAVVQAAKMLRSHDALLTGNPGAKTTKQ